MAESSESSPTLAWVRAAQGGDVASFTRLYEQLAPALLTWADLRIRPAQRAHVEPMDLVQEVWYRAWRQLPDFAAESVPFRLWIFRVAKNVLLEVVRQAQRGGGGRAGAGPTTRMFALNNLPDSVTAVSKRMVRDESLASFRARIEQLAEEERKLVLHCGLEGLPHKEVAERMGLGVEAVTKRWQRLRARLVDGGLPGQLLALERP
jgi:RNA polymerase sigma factor (sigma-70 family)